MSAGSPPVSPPLSAGQQQQEAISSADLAAQAALAALCLEEDSDEFLSADEGYMTADSDEGSGCNAAAGVPLRWLACLLNDELLVGKPSRLSAVTTVSSQYRIKRHPMLLVAFYHALEMQHPDCLAAEAKFSVNALFRIPIVRANAKESAVVLNTWQTIRIRTTSEAEGLVILCAAARAACGLSIERESIAGSIWQNPFCRGVVLTAGEAAFAKYSRARKYTRELATKFATHAVLRDFLTQVLENNRRSFELIARVALF